MFEHLPKINESNLRVVSEKELDYFTNLLGQCTKQTKTPDEAIDCMCEELNSLNHYLVKAIRGMVYAIAGELEDDVKPTIAWGAGIASVPGVLLMLRLIDRAIEVEKLEAMLSQKSTSKK